MKVEEWAQICADRIEEWPKIEEWPQMTQMKRGFAQIGMIEFGLRGSAQSV